MESKNLFGETESDVVMLKLQQENSLLNSIEKLVDVIKENGLNDELLQMPDDNRKSIANALQITELQAILFATFLNRTPENRILIKEISEDLKCSNFRIWRYMGDIEALAKRHFIRCRKNDKELEYRVPNEVLNALRNNQVYQPQSTKNLSVEDFFARIDQLFVELRDDTLTYEDFSCEMLDLLNDNPQLHFSKQIKNLNLSDSNLILCLRFCNLFIESEIDNIRFFDLDDYFPKREFRDIKSSLSNKSNQLFDRKIIECNNDGSFENRSSYRLTDKAKEDLFSELNIANRQAKAKKDLMPFENIAVKQLFYNEKEQK